MIRRPPRSTPLYSSAASDVYKRQVGARQGVQHGSWAGDPRRAGDTATATGHRRWWTCEFGRWGRDAHRTWRRPPGPGGQRAPPRCRQPARRRRTRPERPAPGASGVRDGAGIRRGQPAPWPPWSRRGLRPAEGGRGANRREPRERAPELGASRARDHWFPCGGDARGRERRRLSLIHISEPTRLRRISYAVFCLKKKNTTKAMNKSKITETI